MLNKKIEGKGKREDIHSLLLASIQSINISHTTSLPMREVFVVFFTPPTRKSLLGIF